MTTPAKAPDCHVCPWWLGWTLVVPFRRWLDDPRKLVGPLVSAGQRTLEVGPGYGFFTEPLARAVGPEGRVHCVDLQPKMLDGLRRRLQRFGLLDRAELRTCSSSDLMTADLDGSIDLALLIYVLHEVPDPDRLISQVVRTLKPDGSILLWEPRGHCPKELFESQLGVFREHGWIPVKLPRELPANGRQLALLRLADKH